MSETIVDAARNGNWDLVISHVCSGADVNAVGNLCDTALMHAVDSKKPEMVRFLLEHGANPYIRDFCFRDACDYIQHGDVDTACAVLESGVEGWSMNYTVGLRVYNVFRKYGHLSCEIRARALAAVENAIEEPGLVQVVGDFIQLTFKRRSVYFPNLARLKAEAKEIVATFKIVKIMADMVRGH
jgi:hypothetical protein